jgi:hypothetical protein
VNPLSSEWLALRKTLLWLLTLAFCIYLPACTDFFFADDDIYLAFTNRFLRELPWSDLLLLLQQPANSWEFLPLRDFSYWLDFRLYNGDPIGFHLTNILWYIASAAALGFLLREMIQLCRPAWNERRDLLVIAGVLLFVVHPAHVEAVAWVASRKDLMAGTFSFLAMAILVGSIRRGFPVWDSLLATLMLLCACFSKSAAMATAIFMSVLALSNYRSTPVLLCCRRLILLFLLWIVVLFAGWVHMRTAEFTGIRIENHPGSFLVLERASRVVSGLLGIVLLPYPSGFYYDVYALGAWHWVITVMAGGFVLVAMYIAMARRSLWAFGVLLMISPWVVYLQLIPFTTWSLAGERFVFVSVAGLAMIFIDALGNLKQPWLFRRWLLIIVIPLMAASVWRVHHWTESSNALLVREFERLPSFHNTLRDHIVFTLLPAGRYAEAEKAAKEVQRTYASEALDTLVGVERAYRKLHADRSAEMSEFGNRSDFCSALIRLRLALDEGYRAIPLETDLSYNNLLRSLDRQLQFRYAEQRQLCR